MLYTHAEALDFFNNFMDGDGIIGIDDIVCILVLSRLCFFSGIFCGNSGGQYNIAFP